MRKLWLGLILIGLASCSNTDDVEDTILNGEWTLTNVSCFCGFPDPPEFNLTRVTFYSDRNEVEVRNTGSYVYFREDGSYPYTGNDNQITFENNRTFIFEIDGDRLDLVFVDNPQIADDEIVYTFERN